MKTAAITQQSLPRTERYSRTAIVLHWLMAVLLIVQLGIGLYMVELPKRTPAVAYYYNLHKSLGLIVLGLILLRMWWRYVSPAPISDRLHSSTWQERAARVSHRLLYACMLLIPMFGLTASNFGKHPVRFFGLILPQFGWESPPVQAVFRQAHAVTAWLLCALIVLHVAAVAYHFAKSGTLILQRMLPRT